MRPARKPTPTTPVSYHPDSTAAIAKRTFVSLWVFVGFLAIFSFLYLIRFQLLWIIIATVFALALAPIVDWLVRHKIRRGLAVITTMLVVVVMLIGVITAFATPLIREGNQLITNFPGYVENLNKNESFQRLDDRFNIEQKVRDAANKAPDVIAGAGTGLVKSAAGIFSAATTVLVIITLTIFILIEGPGIWRRFIQLVNPVYAPRIDRVGHKISLAVGGYVTGNLLISVIAGLVTFVTLTILNVPYAVPLAILVAIFDLIPMVGATIATVIVGLVALSVSWVAALIFVAIMLVYQQLEGNVLQPMIYSRTVNLSALWILIASIIGAALGGIIGILLAIPAAGTVQVVLTELLAGTAAGKRAQIQ